MKILMLTADHMMIDRRIIQEAETLARHGYEVRLLAGFECKANTVRENGGVRIERFVYEISEPSLKGALRQLLRFDRPFNAMTHLWRKVRRRFTGVGAAVDRFENFVLERAFLREFDVVHVHDFPMLRIGAVAAARAGVPLVYDAHELYPAQGDIAPKDRKIYEDRERKYIRRCDAVITVNPFIADIMAKTYDIPTPHVILNAVNKVEVTPVDLKSRLGLAPDDRIVVFQGWLSERRGLEKLVDAARHFAPGLRLLLIGYGYHQAALERMAHDAGIEDRVIFYGEVPYEEMLPLLAGADLGVIPYYGIDPNARFCSPNKLFEFVMAGLPFIANDLPFLRTMVDRYGIGRLGDLTTAAGMAEMINAVLADEAGLERIRRSAGAAREELNWDIEGEKLVRLYRPLGGPSEMTGPEAAPKALPR